MKRIKTIESEGFSPYQFKREGCIGEVHLATCMNCKKYRNCKRRIQLRNIMFDTLERIKKETDIKRIADICIYNIFVPECVEANDGE